MIEQGDQFLASMTQLSKITHTIIADRGELSRAHFQLSRDAEKLPREEQKQFKLIGFFAGLEQRYNFPPTAANPAKINYTVHRIQETEPLLGRSVYRDNSIIITRD